MNTVTAVIPAYNTVDRIPDAIMSLLDEGAAVSEIIVVIDDQCDRTAAIASSFGDKMRIIVNDRNMGASASRNRGLRDVGSKYVFFLDSDDWIEPPLLTEMVNLADGSFLDVVFGPSIVQIEHSGVRRLIRPVSSDRDNLFADWLRGDSYVPPCSVMWRTDYVRSIGGWNERLSLWDDAELAMRALLRGARFGMSGEGTGVYRWHASPDRVSKQHSRISDMIGIVDGLIAIEAPAVSPEVVRRAAGEAFYEIARTAFAEEQRATGRQALARARRMGFRGHRGSRFARGLSHLIGLENRMRLRALTRKVTPIGRSQFERETTG